MKFKIGDKIIRNKEVAGALTMWNFSFAKRFEIIDTNINFNDIYASNYIVIIEKSIGKREFLSAYQVDRFYDLDIKELRKDKLLKINEL